LWLPPMLIQPLVENAISHGIEPKTEGGCISIVVRNQAGKLQIRVTDSGVGLEHDSSQQQGVGLANTRQRLNTLYPGQSALSIIQNPEGGVTAGFEILLSAL
ncbi:MAG: ATP-binding protein, partial [Cytophagales bacterium]|nr:ATP-binding protein [Cytophagales bacterium]